MCIKLYEQASIHMEEKNDYGGGGNSGNASRKKINTLLGHKLNWWHPFSTHTYINGTWKKALKRNLLSLDGKRPNTKYLSLSVSARLCEKRIIDGWVKRCGGRFWGWEMLNAIFLDEFQQLIINLIVNMSC